MGEDYFFSGKQGSGRGFTPQRAGDEVGGHRKKGMKEPGKSQKTSQLKNWHGLTKTKVRVQTQEWCKWWCQSTPKN